MYLSFNIFIFIGISILNLNKKATYLNIPITIGTIPLIDKESLVQSSFQASIFDVEKPINEDPKGFHK